MPVDLRTLLDPRHSALLTMECQQAVIGDGAVLPALAEAVRASGLRAHLGTLVRHARAAKVPVVHNLAWRRVDGGGATANCKLLALARRGRTILTPGSSEAAVVPELGPEPGDFELGRLHGISPFHGTELDPILRNLGVRTVVATGVSLNVGVLGLVIEAVNRGYQVVLPRDCVTGTPPEYVALLLEHTYALLTTVTTSAEIAAVWG
jgi:nicotinamidase-related amidase